MSIDRLEQAIERNCEQAHFYASTLPEDTSAAKRQHRLDMLAAWANRVIQLRRQLVEERTACQ